MTHNTITCHIDESYIGQRLDAALAQSIPDYSRSQLQQLIKAGKVTCQQRPVVGKMLVESPMTVELQIEPQQQTTATPEPMDLDVVYCDEDIIVINKPAKLVVHPAAGNHSGTLLNGLLHQFPQCAHLPRAGIVHRLDKDTTGLMVVAHSELAHTSLTEQLQQRTMSREYLALTYGEIIAGKTIETCFGRHSRNRLKMAVKPMGKSAITHFRIHHRYTGFTLLDVKLDTGRTHQIRVHLEHIGHGIVGDHLYGQKRLPKGLPKTAILAIKQFPRQALHATRLQFLHPRNRVLCDYQAPLPDDLQQLLAMIDD